MKKILLAAAVLIAVPTIGQEVKHAPTVQQCQADQSLWFSKLNEPSSTGWAHAANDTSLVTFMDWQDEMSACFAVDPDNEEKYLETTKLTFIVIGARQTDFLIRHGLTRQFLDEDKSGKR